MLYLYQLFPSGGVRMRPCDETIKKTISIADPLSKSENWQRPRKMLTSKRDGGKPIPIENEFRFLK